MSTDQKLTSQVHEIVGRINGRFGTLTAVPIHHLVSILFSNQLFGFLSLQIYCVKKKKSLQIYTLNILLLFAFVLKKMDKFDTALLSPFQFFFLIEGLQLVVNFYQFILPLLIILRVPFAQGRSFS